MKLRIYLTILQLEGYEPGRFLKWVREHPGIREIEGKKPLVWTPKARMIWVLARLMWPVSLVWPEWGLVLAALILSPVERVWRARIKQQTREKIAMLKAGGLKVVAISGSYGKTSVKEYLYQCLKRKYRTVRTPESYNTLLGIARVVEMELWEDTQIFICEMGAYKKGETGELSEMVDPDYAMLTGLNEQHLERFGSLENEILGESESVKYVLKKGGKGVANFGNAQVKKWWGGQAGVIGYGEGKYTKPAEQNSEGAKKMAEVLGVTAREMPKEFEALTHRLNLIRRGGMTIIDDAFSSNTDGFRAAVEYLKTFPGWKVVVTPGIIDLGGETGRIHRELGLKMKGIVDQLILVGKNERTEALTAGYGGGEYINRVGEATKIVKETQATILFENDLPDNY